LGTARKKHWWKIWSQLQILGEQLSTDFSRCDLDSLQYWHRDIFRLTLKIDHGANFCFSSIHPPGHSFFNIHTFKDVPKCQQLSCWTTIKEERRTGQY
jgi:hypothetical protein